MHEDAISNGRHTRGQDQESPDAASPAPPASRCVVCVVCGVSVSLCVCVQSHPSSSQAASRASQLIRAQADCGEVDL